jgi:hypothetical protein
MIFILCDPEDKRNKPSAFVSFVLMYLMQRDTRRHEFLQPAVCFL